MALTLLIILTCGEVRAADWTQLPSLSDKEGFAGPVAGVGGRALIVAGGANFPGKKPWDGGEKVWYNDVFVLEAPGGSWKVAGKLPRPIGYGVSVSHGGGVVCVGGSNADAHYADAFHLEWRDGRLLTTKLPSLPTPLANACGALVGDDLFIAGGLERPDSKHALDQAWRIDLSAQKPKWKPIEKIPGGERMLSVAASFDGAFFILGGVKLVTGGDGKPERQYLRDAYRYDPAQGWERIADLPAPVAAAPSPTPVDATGIYVLGGDDGSQIAVAPEAHRGFSRRIWHYDPQRNKWSEAGEYAPAAVTVPCVLWNKSWVVPSGEVRPGIRSPKVWAFTPEERPR